MYFMYHQWMKRDVFRSETPICATHTCLFSSHNVKSMNAKILYCLFKHTVYKGSRFSFTLTLWYAFLLFHFYVVLSIRLSLRLPSFLSPTLSSFVFSGFSPLLHRFLLACAPLWEDAVRPGPAGGGLHHSLPGVFVYVHLYLSSFRIVIYHNLD